MGYWVVDVEVLIVMDGKWFVGLGELFFFVICDVVGKVDIIVEDFGVIISDVVFLWKNINVLGMVVL